MRNFLNSKNAKQLLLSVTVLIVTPLFANAITAPTDLKNFSELVVMALKGVASILFASLAVGIVYGVVLFMANSDNAEKREQIKSYLLWAVLGIAVALGLWGILAILSATLGWGGGGIPLIKTT